MTSADSVSARASLWWFSLVPASLSVVIAIVMAVVLNNPLGLFYGLAMPLFMLGPLLEQGLMRRRERQREHERRERARAVLCSPAELLPLALSSERIPERGADDYRVRLGIDAQSDVVTVDCREGVAVTGSPMIRHAVMNALEAAHAWFHSQCRDALGDSHSLARWLVALDGRGLADVTDRWGRENVRFDVRIDMLSDHEREAFAALVSGLRSAQASPVFSADLYRDGPHALVSGVTGSGKTVFLRAWIARLIGDDPNIALAILDFKGGGGYADFKGHPQVRHLVSNLRPGEVRAALEGLAAVMERRQELLAKHGCLDIDSLSADVSVARVVIVVDEFRALCEAFPMALALFTDIAARGRALGVHLILATQRFSGVVPEGLTANCSLRIAFRAGDEGESRLMLGSALAWDARLPVGWAFVSRPGSGPERIALAVHDNPSAVQSAESRPEPLWLSPLAEAPRTDQLVPTDRANLVFGLIDDNRALERRTCEHPAVGELVIIVGGPRQVRLGLLASLAEQCGGLVTGGDSVVTWTDLVDRYESGALFVDDLDAQQAALPVAWREEFFELAVSALRSTITEGKTAAVSLTAPSGLLARLCQLPHRLIEIEDSALLRAASHGVTFTPARAVDSVSPAARSNLPIVQLDPRDLLISAYPQRWFGQTAARVATSEEWMFDRALRDSAHRIFVDGLTPVEARSLRLSEQCIPPPQTGTLVHAAPSGAWVRYCSAPSSGL